MSDAERSRDFHEKVLKTLGLRLLMTIPPEGAEPGGEQAKARGTLHGFGVEHKPLFWILGNVKVGAGMHIGFTASTRAQVDAFHEAAIRAGATDKGPPGIRRYHENYYGAFVLDPDGISVEAIATRRSEREHARGARRARFELEGGRHLVARELAHGGASRTPARRCPTMRASPRRARNATIGAVAECPRRLNAGSRAGPDGTFEPS